MIHDIEFVQSRMSKLEGSAALSQHLLSIVQNKLVAQEPDKSASFVEAKPTPAAQVEKPSEEISTEKPGVS